VPSFGCSGARHPNASSDRHNLDHPLPYCMAGIEFRPMIADKDGRFVCRDCAHTVRLGVPEYSAPVARA
jgi:hypothetical protein